MRPLLLIPALLACAGVRTSIDRNLPALPEGKGLVVFSTGAEETSASFATGLKLVTPDDSVSSTDIVVDGALSSSDFDGEHGNVRMIEAGEGTYCLRPVAMNPNYRMAQAPDIAFKVKPGAIVYIGSLVLTRQRTFEVRNRGPRDVAMFREKNPGLKGQRIVISPAALLRKCPTAR